MNRRDWHDRPVLAQFGPACWQSRLLGTLTSIFVRPFLGLMTLVGLLVNPIRPDLLQRVRLDLVDKLFRGVRPLAGTDVQHIELPHCPAERVVAPGSHGPGRGKGLAIVYFHGSALVTLGLNSHRRFASELSAVTGTQVFNVGYRLAPQAGIEEAIADGVAAYRHVLSLGYSPERIVLAGDSAGGLMAAQTALAARDAGLPVPAGQVLLSPLTSSDMDIKYRAMKASRDVLFPFATVKFIYDVFATVNGTKPLPVMPTDADLHGLGPFLLQVGTEEMLRNDTFALADKLTAAHVPNWVQVWDKAMHMFQLSFDVNPDARRAVGEIAEFIAYATARSGEATA